MSIHEIEQAMTELSPIEVERLPAWLATFPTPGEGKAGSANGRPGRAATLADAMGDLLGAVGREGVGAKASSRDGGEAFTDYLVNKKREQRLRIL